MYDTIEGLLADILASAGPDGPRLAERVEALSHEQQSEIAALRNELNKAKALIRLKDTQIRELKGQNAKLKKMMFGANADRNPDKGTVSADAKNVSAKPSEAISCEPTQNSGSSQSNERPKRTPSAPSNYNGRGKRVWPKHLERHVIYMDTSDKKCWCGCGGTVFGYDVNETLELIPARYIVVERHYPKYRCRAKEKIVGTPFVPRIFPHTSMSNGILANAIFMRFGAQLPWYRQESILRSYGIDLKRSTLMKWTTRVATQALLPIYELLMQELLQNSPRLFMDETTIPMLAPGTGKTSTSYLFAIHRDDRSFGGNLPPIVSYCPSKTRAMYQIHELLNGVTAIVQTDAYAGYGQLGREGTTVEGIISPKCWAHTRRYFTDEYEFNKTEDARIIIGMIAELYAEEDKVRGKPPHVREAHRRKYSEYLPVSGSSWTKARAAI